MARFSGNIGFVIPTETSPGVFKDVVTEKHYRGVITQNNFKIQTSDKVVDDVVVNDVISVVGDRYMLENGAYMKYVCYLGTRVKITNIATNRPRFNLNIGGVYNGPAATSG